MGGSDSVSDTTVQISAMVDSSGAVATAIGLNASTLQLRPGDDTIPGYGIGRDSFIRAGDGDDLVSLGRLETTPGDLPLQRAKGDPIQPSTYRGGAGFDVLHLRDTTQAEFEAQATPFRTANESGWLFQGARFSGFEQFLFG
jgi:hypothetical protein